MLGTGDILGDLLKTAEMTKARIEKLLEQYQMVQQKNPPTSREWRAASERIHELAEMLTGKKPVDAWGKSSAKDDGTDQNAEADFEQVADHLRTDAGIADAEVVATGGNIDCIRIPCGEYVMYFGTAAEVWGASVYTVINGEEVWTEDEPEKSDVWTDVSSNETDPTAVALGITEAAMEFDQKYCGGKHKGKKSHTAAHTWRVKKTGAAQAFQVGDAVKSKWGPTGKVTGVQQDASGAWVYSVDYKKIGPKNNQPERELSRASNKIKAPYTPATGKDLADYLKKVGYRLWVMVRKPENLAKVRMQYEEATGGDSLPGDCVVEQYGGKGNFDEEWFIQAPYSEDMPSDVDIVEGGSGSGYGKQPYPVGIRQGNTVTFSYWETVKEMLQSGLRARRK